MNLKKSILSLLYISMLIIILTSGLNILSMNVNGEANTNLLTFDEGSKYRYTWDVPLASFSFDIDIYITDVNQDHWEGIIVRTSFDLDSFLYKFRAMKDDLSIYATKQLRADQIFDEDLEWNQILSASSENPIVTPLVFPLNVWIYDFDLEFLIDQKTISAIWSGGVQSNLSLQGPTSYLDYSAYQVLSQTLLDGVMPETTTIYYLSVAEPYILIYQTLTIGSTENYTTIELVSVEEKTFDPNDYDIFEQVSEDNIIPIGRINFEISGLTVSFDASDSEGEIVKYQWNFGDGNSGSGQHINHTYQYYGNFSFTLTVMNDQGLTDSKTMVIFLHSDEQSKPSPTPGFELFAMIMVIGFIIFFGGNKND